MMNLAFLEYSVPDGTDDILISVFRNMEDEQLDCRQIKWHGVFLV